MKDHRPPNDSHRVHSDTPPPTGKKLTTLESYPSHWPTGPGIMPELEQVAAARAKIGPVSTPASREASARTNRPPTGKETVPEEEDKNLAGARELQRRLDVADIRAKQAKTATTAALTLAAILADDPRPMDDHPPYLQRVLGQLEYHIDRAHAATDAARLATGPTDRPEPETVLQVDRRIDHHLREPGTHYHLRDAWNLFVGKDPWDVVHDLETLAAMARDRRDAIVAHHDRKKAAQGQADTAREPRTGWPRSINAGRKGDRTND